MRSCASSLMRRAGTRGESESRVRAETSGRDSCSICSYESALLLPLSHCRSDLPPFSSRPVRELVRAYFRQATRAQLQASSSSSRVGAPCGWRRAGDEMVRGKSGISFR